LITGIEWLAIIGIPSIVSAVFMLGLNSLLAYFWKPRLELSKEPYSRIWEIEDRNTGNKHTWKFINFEVTCRRGLALQCEAKATIVKHPSNVSLVQELRKDGYGIHWADMPYSERSTSVDRVDIGSVPQRLDVVFAVPNQNAQSYLAMPIALNSLWNKGTCVPQAILPQGEYVLKVKVACANGKGDTKKIKLISPDSWQQLEASRL